jgi:predicted Zn-dependent protease
LSRETPGDARVWMAIALFGEAGDPAVADALRTVRGMSDPGIGQRLSLAVLFLARQEYHLAREQLEAAVQEDPANLPSWELLARLAQEQGDAALLDTSVRALLTRNPDHFLQYMNRGIAFYQKGQRAEAEQAFREGIRRKRDPILLNNLATLIQERGGDLEEALRLINEAVRQQPRHGGLRRTRAEIYLAMGRPEAARLDLQDSLKKQGRNDATLLLLGQAYAGVGDRDRALKVAVALARHPDKLSPAQRRRVAALIKSVR